MIKNIIKHLKLKHFPFVWLDNSKAKKRNDQQNVFFIVFHTFQLIFWEFFSVLNKHRCRRRLCDCTRSLRSCCGCIRDKATNCDWICGDLSGDDTCYLLGKFIWNTANSIKKYFSSPCKAHPFCSFW